jgi:hypothetical protein
MRRMSIYQMVIYGKWSIIHGLINPTFCRRTMPSGICLGSQSSGRRTLSLQLYYAPPPPRVPSLTLLRACVESNLCSCLENSKWHSKHHRPQNCFWRNLDVTSLHLKFSDLWHSFQDESNVFKVKGLYHKLLTLVFVITVIIIHFALTSINQNNDCHFGNTLLFNDCIISKIILKMMIL